MFSPSLDEDMGRYQFVESSFIFHQLNVLKT